MICRSVRYLQFFRRTVNCGIFNTRCFFLICWVYFGYQNGISKTKSCSKNKTSLYLEFHHIFRCFAFQIQIRSTTNNLSCYYRLPNHFHFRLSSAKKAYEVYNPKHLIPVGVCSIAFILELNVLTACPSVLFSSIILNGIDVRFRLYHFGLSPMSAGS